MKLLLVFATHPEAKELLQKFGIKSDLESQVYSFESGHIGVDVIITGIGMVNTAYYLGKQFASNSYDVALNVGLAGSFDRSIRLGEVVNITEECISELGAEDGEKFLRIDQMNPNIADKSDSPYELINKSRIKNVIIDHLISVKGISVNTVHGEDKSIGKVKSLFSPSVESMEGAAFFVACANVGIKFAEIRAISNYVEQRNTSNWEIDKAVKEFTGTIEEILKAF